MHAWCVLLVHGSGANQHVCEQGKGTTTGTHESGYREAGRGESQTGKRRKRHQPNLNQEQAPTKPVAVTPPVRLPHTFCRLCACAFTYMDVNGSDKARLSPLHLAVVRNDQDLNIFRVCQCVCLCARLVRQTDRRTQLQGVSEEDGESQGGEGDHGAC